MTHDICPSEVFAQTAAPLPTTWQGDAPRPTVLLCSVFGPYGRDDQYGSRRINPMELWHNQVTRVQGAFSLRMFHRSWGLMLIQANIETPCTCLDFPTRDRFIEELQTHDYDIIGISAIMPNVLKVEEMCRLIRRHQPKALIVVGGHIANLPGLSARCQADHVVRGDGVRWFRELLGEDISRPLSHPQIWSGLNRRCMGVDLPFSPASSAAALIPSVGCPVGCNFCSTSAMFGGKGHSVDFFETAEDLFAVMSNLADEMKTRSFFVMDENFLLRRKRALRLLELMQAHDRAWAIYVFSSANAIRQYTMEQLVGLGVSWLWLGLEGEHSQYGKLNDTDTHQLVAELQNHGIRVLGSSIVGLEEHTPENIDAVIDYAVSHETDFHQFMLYTPIPGTPLYAEHEADGTLLGEAVLDLADTHGQKSFNFRHAHIRDGQETAFLLRAFERDFRTNGPSTVRMIRTLLKGHRRYKTHPDGRIRRRFRIETDGMWAVPTATVWSARRWFGDNPEVFRRMDALLRDLYAEFGLKARIAAPLIGRYLLNRARREEERLRAAGTLEPPTFYERNYASDDEATLLKSVAARPREPAAPSPVH
ncbi:MAG: radical SAM protein [Bacteroidetes bacterium]|jgi:hypothetical protein|nr:radical SAM protein [Bacteroidota bacterium]